jgi:hypothetical protein
VLKQQAEEGEEPGSGEEPDDPLGPLSP